MVPKCILLTIISINNIFPHSFHSITSSFGLFSLIFSFHLSSLSLYLPALFLPSLYLSFFSNYFPNSFFSSLLSQWSFTYLFSYFSLLLLGRLSTSLSHFFLHFSPVYSFELVAFPSFSHSFLFSPSSTLSFYLFVFIF